MRRSSSTTRTVVIVRGAARLLCHAFVRAAMPLVECARAAAVVSTRVAPVAPPRSTPEQAAQHEDEQQKKEKRTEEEPESPRPVIPVGREHRGRRGSLRRRGDLLRHGGRDAVCDARVVREESDEHGEDECGEQAGPAERSIVRLHVRCLHVPQCAARLWREYEGGCTIVLMAAGNSEGIHHGDDLMQTSELVSLSTFRSTA